MPVIAPEPADGGIHGAFSSDDWRCLAKNVRRTAAHPADIEKMTSLGEAAAGSRVARIPASERRLPIGAEVHGERIHFRVWAPRSGSVKALISKQADMNALCAEQALDSEPGGYFSGWVDGVVAGAHYKFQLDQGVFPDPASRFQPLGPEGASRIVDPRSFPWSDEAWGGVDREGLIIYEMHIGSFTQAGDWRAAMEQLEELAKLGITMIEVMPVADFAGRRGWGYDGVNLFAPTRLYGEPDDFRAFVDKAHSLKIGVILDVVYNHLGPDGNILPEYSEDYLSHEKTEWGNSLNFDGENSQSVREFFLANARYWIDEFHLDGLRLDATQQIFDRSADHILAAITREVRSAARGRGTYIVGENEPQEARLARPAEAGGYGMDALWNDDFHHSAMVALTGRNEAYYSDYRGSAQEFVAAAKRGFLYQGQYYRWQKKRRGTPCLDLDPARFVTFIQNHDQVANSLRGHRIHSIADAGSVRAMTALLLLGPSTPMLFQGQEFAASTPFLYFADHREELAKAVAAGRLEFLRQFPSINASDAAAIVASPEKEETFLLCKLDFADRQRHAGIYEMHRDLIELRKSQPLIGRARPGTFDGAVLGQNALALRYFGRARDDRLLLVNLGAGIHLDPSPEPLLAPPESQRWEVIWSSEDPRYGGTGTEPLESEQENWRIPAHAAALLVPKPFSPVS
jgi:maltooligosyltrehalose trehalohydrolase